MDEESQSQDQCSVPIENDAGETNLCCCYAVDSDGTYKDLCYTPADECC